MTPDRWHESGSEFGEIGRDPGRSAGVIHQLEEYFSGERLEFTVPLSIIGTAFFPVKEYLLEMERSLKIL